MTTKRKDISLKGEDKYSHWWTELRGESYGWWPKYPVGLWETLTGVEGELNGVTSFGGSSTRDIHHGDSADEQFNPRVQDAAKTDAQRSGISCLRKSLQWGIALDDWLGPKLPDFPGSFDEHCGTRSTIGVQVQVFDSSSFSFDLEYE